MSSKPEMTPLAASSRLQVEVEVGGKSVFKVRWYSNSFTDPRHIDRFVKLVSCTFTAVLAALP